MIFVDFVVGLGGTEVFFCGCVNAAFAACFVDDSVAFEQALEQIYVVPGWQMLIYLYLTLIGICFGIILAVIVIDLKTEKKVEYEKSKPNPPLKGLEIIPIS